MNRLTGCLIAGACLVAGAYFSKATLATPEFKGADCEIATCDTCITLIGRFDYVVRDLNGNPIPNVPPTVCQRLSCKQQGVAPNDSCYVCAGAKGTGDLNHKVCVAKNPASNNWCNPAEWTSDTGTVAVCTYDLWYNQCATCVVSTSPQVVNDQCCGWAPCRDTVRDERRVMSWSIFCEKPADAM